ncbi:lysine--tRNA ligase [Rickettsiella endosymbiont of Litargus connexus]|jgi:lysyl-tRNA synthetase class 2|uniref:lysine--tRNA ligase n=1 Tax=Rickettsiella endosymbiont of Litargus connexus TaxID=3066237 RepID=UPI00376EB127|nr:lysine--tRNA ligase [Candidatus Rickettsiella isopodorum]MDD5161953.1 lysine--tRNA ligase [Candidatus Rickettsiella isopodorum]
MSHEKITISHNTEDLFSQRLAKLNDLRQISDAYPNTFRRDSLAADLYIQFEQANAELLQQKNFSVRLAGRVMLKRDMGKSLFLDIQDMSGKMQVYVKQDNIGLEDFEMIKRLDLGDIVGIVGVLFRTKTNQLSIKAEKVYLLSKSLRPLPDKFHGLSESDKEQRYRQRYLDLISNEKTRKTFQIRSQLINGLRQFLNQRGFVEVETPMMHVLPGGALARPFITHHNALDMELFLRVAPELHLKRLVVGGMEKVFEINRNFRNEGLSTRHNPEFTMLEFYQAYADYHDLMDLTEQLIRELAQTILDTEQLTYQGETYDLSKPFKRLSVINAILEYNPQWQLKDVTELRALQKIAADLKIPASESVGQLQFAVFEETVEQKLKQPTFITEYPIDVSPLARRNNDDPQLAERFELYIGGRELANGFSELNDPEDQAARFKQQSRSKLAGDLEAMPYDEDYILALEYGLPPTAGEGIGIDRLAMLFTDSASIRDVILFPLMRPETKSE